MIHLKNKQYKKIVNPTPWCPTWKDDDYVAEDKLFPRTRKLSNQSKGFGRFNYRIYELTKQTCVS